MIAVAIIEIGTVVLIIASLILAFIRDRRK